MTIKTADLCDDFASELTVCSLDMKSFGKHKRFAGPVATVRVFEDNVLVKEALETIPAGYVLVVDGGGSTRCALMGDRLGAIAEDRKLAGVIINGCVRDTVDLGSQEIGVVALGSNPLKSVKEGKGQRDVLLDFGDVQWKPGNYVYADEDGIVVAQRKLD
ncbi:ribonuclease E activity regulator RraA [Filibacter tadaridae]|uniref:4-hydroxy-4-methyl-2-oxoglutarate aldolase n=1 Tax=Filibacter tadaridae TaxID=2483811 RepID=A0A3P5XG47_9BACL|nr:ribonuclease E activity regulator RraA [Filibacter tadaridae]VDC27526.1 Putative regulator of ribonuclease activity [Filibacter tadaridae]